MGWLHTLENVATGVLPVAAGVLGDAFPEAKVLITAGDAAATFGFDDFVRHDGWKESLADAGVSAYTTFISSPNMVRYAEDPWLVSPNAVMAVGTGAIATGVGGDQSLLSRILNPVASTSTPASSGFPVLVNLGTGGCPMDDNPNDLKPTGMYPVFAPAEARNGTDGVSASVFRCYMQLPGIFCSAFKSCGKPLEATSPPVLSAGSVGPLMNDIWKTLYAKITEIPDYVPEKGTSGTMQMAGKQQYTDLVGRLSGDFENWETADRAVSKAIVALEKKGWSTARVQGFINTSLQGVLTGVQYGINRVLAEMRTSLEHAKLGNLGLPSSATANTAPGDVVALAFLENAVNSLHIFMAELGADLQNIATNLEFAAGNSKSVSGNQ